MHVLIPALHRPTKPTGVCRHAVNLARCLADTTAVTQVTVIIGAWQDSYFNGSFDLSSSKIKLVSIAIDNSSISRNFWFLFGLPETVNKYGPDLVHLSFPFPFIRSSFNCPVVSSLHDLYPYECPENFGFPQVLFNRLFLRQCIYGSDGIACVSEVTEKLLELYFPKNLLSTKEVDVVYNYVDFSPAQAKISGKLKLLKPSEYLLSVAQHRKNKNLDMLIKAYAVLMETGVVQSTSNLVIVGSSGPETGNLLDLIEELSLSGNVILTSSIEDSELLWLYTNCQLFVIPSSTEGFCIPLVEAISLGVPVVCSNIPIFKEVGSVSGCRYFDLGSNAIENLVTSITHGLMVNDNCKSFEYDRRFTKQAVSQKCLDFYDVLLK